MDRTVSRGIAPHFTGIASELKAATYYAEMGYEIFFPMSSQSRCDFIAVNIDETIKVQAKTVTRNISGKYQYKQCRILSRNQGNSGYKHSDCDVFVFVDMDDLYVIPSEKIIGRTSVSFGSTNPDYKLIKNIRGIKSDDLTVYLVDKGANNKQREYV